MSSLIKKVLNGNKIKACISIVTVTECLHIKITISGYFTKQKLFRKKILMAGSGYYNMLTSN